MLIHVHECSDAKVVYTGMMFYSCQHYFQTGKKGHRTLHCRYKYKQDYCTGKISRLQELQNRKVTLAELTLAKTEFQHANYFLPLLGSDCHQECAHFRNINSTEQTSTASNVSKFTRKHCTT